MKEFEIIKHTHMSLIEIFIVEMTARGPHGHDDLEVGILLEGALNLYLEQESYLLKAGDIYVINRHQVHSFAKTTSKNRILAFQINTNLYRKIHPSYNYLFFKDNIIQSGCLHSNLSELLFAVAQFYFLDMNFSDLKCSSLLLEALYLLLTYSNYEISSEKESTSARNNAKRLSRITDYIALHYNEKLTLSQIADIEDISEYHLSHFITKMIGISFQEYLTQVRFEHALHLINETNLTLLDICMETGFSSTRYLNQCFQKNFGCSAKQYLKTKKKPLLTKTVLPTENIQLKYSYEQSKLYFSYANVDIHNYIKSKLKGLSPV